MSICVAVGDTNSVGKMTTGIIHSFIHILVSAMNFAHLNDALLTELDTCCIIWVTIGNYLKYLLLLGMQLKQDRVQMFVATRYATNQEVEFKCLRLHSEKSGAFPFRKVV